MPVKRALKAFCWAFRGVLRLPAFPPVQKGTSRQKWFLLSCCMFGVFFERPEAQNPRVVLWTIHPH